MACKRDAPGTCRLPGALEAVTTEAAPAVLGAFADKDPSTHSELWGMVLSYSQAFPSAWRAVDMRKGILPKLLAFLR